MADVDAILRSGEYTDRRGREWALWHDLSGGQSEWVMWGDPRFEHPLTPAQMRTLIERDLHRDKCPGIKKCVDHPVLIVERCRATELWQIVDTSIDPELVQGCHGTFTEAIAAAHNMTGAER